MQYKIVCEHISKIYESAGRKLLVLDDISFSVRENEFLVLLGPGGCGKTTLLYIIEGLVKPTTGRVLLDGKEIQGPGVDRGIVFQHFALLPWKTVLENVEFGLKIRGVPKEERIRISKELIEIVGLKGFENYYPHELSGGMQQRVGIARAYASNPEVLLMDEPFGHVDAQTRYYMQKEILRIWEKLKKTVIFVTNNIEEAIYLGDRVIVLSKLPAKIKATFDIELPRPREYTDPDFLKIREEISEQTEFAL